MMWRLSLLMLLACDSKVIGDNNLRQVPTTCGMGTQLDGSECVAPPSITCGAGTELQDRTCVGVASCGTGTHQDGGECVPDSQATTDGQLVVYTEDGIAFYPADAGPATQPTRTITGAWAEAEAINGHLAFGPDRKTYLLHYQGNVDVFAADASGESTPIRSFTPDVGTFSFTGLAVDEDGLVYIAVNGVVRDGSVDVFAADATGSVTPIRSITGTDTTLRFGARAIAIGPDGDLYVSSGEEKPVAVFPRNADGNMAPSSVVGLDTYLWGSNGVAFDAQGLVYVGYASGFIPSTWDPMYASGVFVFDPEISTRVPIRFLGAHGGDFDNQVHLAVANNGTVFRVDYSVDDVVVYAPQASGNAEPSRRLPVYGSIAYLPD